MAVLGDIARENAPSPDALLHHALEGDDPKVLEALSVLCMVQFLGDFPLLARVRHRQLELAQLAGDAELISDSEQNLAATYWRNGQLSLAEKYCRECLTTRQRLFGPTGMKTLDITNLLAHIMKDSKRLAEAEPLYRTVLSARTATLGPEHLDTAGSTNNLAVLLVETQQYAKAEALYLEALAVRREKAGALHRSTLLTTYLLACLLERRPARRAEALRRFEEVYEGRVRTLGQEHRETREAYMKVLALR